MNAPELAGIRAEVVAAEDRRYAAMVAGDTAALADLLSETLIYVHTTGDTDTRQSYLDAVHTGFVDYRHLERRDERWPSGRNRCCQLAGSSGCPCCRASQA